MFMCSACDYSHLFGRDDENWINFPFRFNDKRSSTQAYVFGSQPKNWRFCALVWPCVYAYVGWAHCCTQSGRELNQIQWQMMNNKMREANNLFVAEMAKLENPPQPLSQHRVPRSAVHANEWIEKTEFHSMGEWLSLDGLFSLSCGCRHLLNGHTIAFSVIQVDAHRTHRHCRIYRLRFAGCWRLAATTFRASFQRRWGGSEMGRWKLKK